MNTRTLECRHDGKRLVGEFCWDERTRGPKPGILVVHEGGGINDHPKERARRLVAEFGYAAVACDLYGNGESTRDAKRRSELMGELRSDPSKLRARAQVWIDALASLPEVDPARLAAIGFCFGGMTVLELARAGAAIAGVVSFHGILATQRPAAPGEIRAKVMACHGAEDPFAPAEQVAAFVAEMRAARADWQLVLFGGAAHGFTRRDAATLGLDGVAYDARADQRSWDEMGGFLKSLFG